MYATIADMRSRLGKRSDELYEPPADYLIEQDLIAAGAEIDGALARRYVVPIAAAQALPLLRHWTLTLAEEMAWSRVGFDRIPEEVATRVENVRKLLALYATNERVIPGAATAESTAVVAGEDRIFTPDSLQGY